MRHDDLGNTSRFHALGSRRGSLCGASEQASRLSASHVSAGPVVTTEPPGQGTGLGLATAYALVKQNGGFIWLASEPGHGTEATLYFPVVSSRKCGAGTRSAARFRTSQGSGS